MSLGVAIKGPEGVVLAADSRVTVGALIEGHQVPIHYDNASKILALSADTHQHLGAVTYGAALVGGRTAHSYLPELEPTLPHERISVEDFAKRLSDFFMERWKAGMPATYDGPPLTLLVGGFDQDEPYGSVFLLNLPYETKPQPRNPGNKDFGITWGGQLQIASRLIFGYDPALLVLLKERFGLDDASLQKLVQDLRPKLEFKLPYDILPLQDCVDLATFLIRTTITAQSLSVGIRGVGGQIEVAVITRTGGLRFVQQKQLRGEPGSSRSRGENV